MSADEVLTGIGPVFALADFGLRWTVSDMGSSFPVLRPVPVAAGAGHLLMKKAPRDGVPGRSEYEIRRPIIDQCATIPLVNFEWTLGCDSAGKNTKKMS